MTAGTEAFDGPSAAKRTAEAILSLGAVHFYSGQPVHLHFGLGQPRLHRLQDADLVPCRAPSARR